MPRILIVDDDDSIRMLYAEELGEEGYEVLTCGDGALLLDLIQQSNPDLIVMDVRLGKDNGLELLKKIRKTTYSLPVILCTAYRVYRYDPISIAADYYIVKSSDLSELKLKIKLALADNRPVFKNILNTSYMPMTAHC
jgi:DNA-binding response OmpR family regulator